MIRQSVLYFLARAGNGILSLATMATFTRILSPQEYGVYSLGMAIPTMASAVLFQWLNVAVGRFYPLHEDKPDMIMTAVARGFWCATAIAALLFLAALPFHETFGVKVSLYGILFLITVMLGRHTLALQMANTQRTPLRFGLLSWTRGVGAFLIGLALIQYGAGAQGALLGFLAGLVIAVLIFSPKLRLGLGFRSAGAHKSSDMFRFGLPMSVNFFAIVIVDVADRFMIGGLLGAERVAPYAVAYELVQQSIGPIMNVLFLATFPIIVQVLEVEGDESARIRLRSLGCGLIGIGLPAVFGLAVLSGDISEVVFGSSFRQDAAMIMPWLAAAIFLGCFKNYFVDVVFQLRHLSKYQGYIAAFMATVNVVLNLLLLPRYGVIAAAWSTFAAFAVGLLLSWLVAKTLFPLPSVGKNFLGAAVASVLMAIALYMLPLMNGVMWLLAKIVLGIFIYSALAWILNVANCRSYFYDAISRRIFTSKNVKIKDTTR